MLTSLFSKQVFAGTILLSVAMCSCNRIQEKASEKWNEAKNETAEQKEKLLKKGFDAVFGEASSKATTFREQFPNYPELKVEHLEGLWIDMPAGYYYCFLKYKTTDKKKLLQFLEQQPTKNTRISDSKCSETTSEKLNTNLQLLKTDYPDVYKQLSFFSDFPDKKGIVYYRCSRYPKSHVIAIDQTNGIVYHHFERYSD